MNEEKQGKLPDQKELDEMRESFYAAAQKPVPVSEEERIENEVARRINAWISTRIKAENAKRRKAASTAKTVLTVTCVVVPVMLVLAALDIVPTPVAQFVCWSFAGAGAFASGRTR